ncbi:MAG: GTP pyrophosphokinase, partial [Deltaproteobacteria bacterium]
KAELEDLCFYYLDPEMYEKIKNAIAQRREEQERFIREVKEILERELTKAGIKAYIKGRPKHLYSIYRKVISKDIPVDQLHDVIGFRVIVDSVRECYETLGIVHSIWKQVPGRFKDYISLPKENMYQSLHTTVIGPYGQKMEIQIRTWEMDRIAEEGIAAHWKYKEGKGIKENDEKIFSWLRQIIEESQQHLSDSREFLENIKMNLNLFPEEVYVFTPKGEVKSFPKGATPVDFAYSIHSDIGDRCVAAKVDGRLVPLDYELKSGSVVEIITSPKQHPSKDWLTFVKTPRARSKIRQWLRRHERERSISLGKEMLEKAISQEHIRLSNKEEILASIAADMSLRSVEDLYAQIGIGSISANQVIGRIKQKLHIKESPLKLVTKLVDKLRKKKTETKGIKIKGLDDIVVHLAKCCYPIPGDPVIGFITRGKGITIHRYDCKSIKDADPIRLIDVTWESTEDETYPARLMVLSVNKMGMLADISAAIAKKEANIISANVDSTADNKGIAFFTVEVKNLDHLNEVIRSIKRIKDIISAKRI